MGLSPRSVLVSVAWSLGTTAAAWVVWRRRDSLVAAILLVVSGLGLSIFKTHAWPGGPVSFGALALAAAWLQWQGVDASRGNA
jgi:pimeloyl-ACP methyl ester carboxylesterase